MIYSAISVRNVVCVVTLGAMTLSATGCETLTQDKETTVGAGGGALAGGLIGGVAGGKKGAVIGAGVGALAGGMIGHYVAQKDRDRTQAVAAVGYRPEQGNSVSIERSDAAPAAAAPGQAVKVSTQYTVLAPNNDKLTVRESREVRYQGKVISSDAKEVQRDQGTYTVSFDYPVAKDAKAGAYEVVTTVAVGEKTQQGTATFRVN